MTDLETIELALRRALDGEIKERVQDMSTIHTLNRVVSELERIHRDRRGVEQSQEDTK